MACGIKIAQRTYIQVNSINQSVYSVTYSREYIRLLFLICPVFFFFSIKSNHSIASYMFSIHSFIVSVVVSEREHHKLSVFNDQKICCRRNFFVIYCGYMNRRDRLAHTLPHRSHDKFLKKVSET